MVERVDTGLYKDVCDGKKDILNGGRNADLKDSDLKIVLNSAIQYEPRIRFTLAHELGHIFISWHSDVTLCVTDNEYSEHNKLDIQEHEANVFAFVFFLLFVLF